MKNSRERDQSIERLLRQSPHRTTGGVVTEKCLDPETLAAWADSGLFGAALESAQSHVADCARCQALVGTLARINTAVPVPGPARVARGWLPWLAPLTAAAVALAAVALWITVPRSSGLERQARETSAPVTAPRVSGAKADGSVEHAPEARGTDERQLQTDLSSAVAGIPAAPRAAVGVGSNDAKESKETAKAELAPTNQPGLQASELRKDAVGRLEAGGNSQQPLASPPPAAAAAAAPLADKATAAATSTSRVAPTIGFEVVSPDPAVRWRIAGSTVQRSTNAASTWQDVATGFTGQLTAGAAPSPSVCWLVGRGGFMLLASVTTTGVSWRRISFPEPTDLSAVRATDARTASVTSVDGRTFSTTDGGATWVRVTPQDF